MSVYMSQDGKLLEVSKMQDNHLMNAYLKTKKRLEALMPKPFQHKLAVIQQLQSQLEVLHKEIKRRKLV